MKKVKLKPRFYVIILSVLLSCVIFISFSFIKKKIELRLVDDKSKNVLAASDSLTATPQNRNPYDLIEAESVNRNNEGASPNGDISTYQPVTISYTVKQGDTIYTIAEKYHADPQTIVDFPNNEIGEDFQLKVGQIVIIPNGYEDDSQLPPPPPIAHGTGQFAWPTVGGRITQYAYYWHPGSIDIAVPVGTSINAADDGTVEYAGWDKTGYGNTVLISHGDGLTSRYGHLSKITVVVGQGIHRGGAIGFSGSTGHSTGPHLHFEVRRNGAAVDPMTLLPPDVSQPAPNSPDTLPPKHLYKNQ